MDARRLLPVFRDLMGVDNVIGVGHGHKMVRGEDTGRQAVVILVEKKFTKDDLRRNAVVPRMINGLPTDVIEVGHIRLLNDRTQMLRPAQPGLSMGHYKVSAGTFGGVVRDRATGEKLILSNNHVLANLTNGIDGRSVLGDAILQPGLYDGGNNQDGIIGHLERFVPLQREFVAPQCRIAKLFQNVLNRCVSFFRPEYQVRVLRQSERLNLVDCAVAKPVDPSMISPDILEVGAPVGIKEPKVGMPVKKSGRSSGLTYSIVLATDVTIKVSLNNVEYGVFTEQILAGPMSRPGDSGSLILTEDNYAVGLLFAGSESVTMFNRLENVFAALNVELVTS